METAIVSNRSLSIHAPEASAATKQILQNLRPKEFSNANIEDLKKRIFAIEPSQWHALIEAYVHEAHFEDPAEAMAPLLSVLSLEQIEAAFQKKYDTSADAVQAAKDMIVKAKDYFEKIEEKRMSPTLYLRIMNLFYAILNAFESILVALGVGDLFTPAENEMDAGLKMHRMMMLMTLLSTLAALIIPLIGISEVTGLIIAGSLLGLGVITFIYFKFLKPVPNHLPKAENWSEQIANGQISVVDFKKEEIDGIADKLIAHKLVALVGPSGVGKTERARTLVYNNLRGDYPQLQDKTFFYIDTGALATKTGGQWGDSERILNKISEEMGKDREHCVLIFDEIQSACKEKEGVLSERLKIFFDRGVNSFPYVIVLTTEQEFDEYIVKQTGGALVRRFLLGKVNVESTDKAQTLKILESTVLRQARDVLVEKGGLDYLYEQTIKHFPNDPQPYTSCNLVLNRCLQKVKKDQALSLKQTEIDKAQSNIDLLSVGSLPEWTFLSGHEEAERSLREAQLRQTLATLRTNIEQAKQDINQVFEERKTLMETKEKVYKTVLELDPEKEQQKLKQMLLLSRFVIPVMEAKVKSHAEKVEVKVTIDKPLIDEVIKQILDERADARAREKSAEAHAT